MNDKTNQRILMLLENNPYPGDLRVRREARSLVAAGFQVTVIAPGAKGQPRYECVDGVHAYRFPAPAPGDGFLGYLWEYGWSVTASFVLAWWVFFRRGFDVVHAHNPPDLFVLIYLWFAMFGKKFVFDHHDLSPEMYYARFRNGGNRMVYRALVFFEKLSCRCAHQVIATNESYKRMEIERSRISEDRISIVRNGPDLRRIKPVDPDPDLRQKADNLIGFVGLMGEQDGVDYFLRALHHLVNELGREDFFAVIIGTGDAVPRLKKLTTELALDDKVWFTGRVSDADMLRYLSTVDVCVDPDPYNPFNDRSTMIKMMDYLALGKPIVAFDLTEHRATAQQAALYARHNDEADFADKIIQLADDPQLRQQMGDYGRKRMEDVLAWHHQENSLLTAYEKMGFVVERRKDSASPAEGRVAAAAS